MGFRDRLISIKEERHLSNTDIAEAAGVSEGAVRHWLLDNRTPSIESVQILAKNLNLSVDFLLGEKDDTARDSKTSGTVFVRNFESYCKSIGKSPNRVCLEIGLSNATYTHWKKRGVIPHSATLGKIAEYFGISINDLIAEKDEQNVDDLKVALFGGDGEVTDEMWEEVKQFAQFVKARNAKKAPTDGSGK